MKLAKLNHDGFTHVMIAAVMVVIGVAAFGTYVVVKSNANSFSSTKTSAKAKPIYAGTVRITGPDGKSFSSQNIFLNKGLQRFQSHISTVSIVKGNWEFCGVPTNRALPLCARVTKTSGFEDACNFKFQDGTAFCSLLNVTAQPVATRDLPIAVAGCQSTQTNYFYDNYKGCLKYGYHPDVSVIVYDSGSRPNRPVSTSYAGPAGYQVKYLGSSPNGMFIFKGSWKVCYDIDNRSDHCSGVIYGNPRNLANLCKIEFYATSNEDDIKYGRAPKAGYGPCDRPSRVYLEAVN